MASQTRLDLLRQRTIVDCDTLDEQVVRDLGPFQDCYCLWRALKPEHTGLIQASISDAEFLAPRFTGIEALELAVEVATARLALKIVPLITGYVHIQTNPYNAYSTGKTVANAFRIIFQIFRNLDPAVEATRICVKIPSTWEGLMACKILETAGVRTLATTLFAFAQAALAAEAGCTYIAPYVNQLKVHFELGFVDRQKLLPLCVSIQRYYEAIGSRTQVVSASLTSTDEIFALAGVHHITEAPFLPQQLSSPTLIPVALSLLDSDLPTASCKAISYMNRESEYRLAFSRAERGGSEGKLTQAINIFCEMQDNLIALFKAASCQ
ncbi:hypothetical protein BJY04DRAFT_216740 [Aspergillus karnatakaensis]|uniref:uncharacterized protein n=1 Tax=Aspergillus karnatakaensis TaxID=1810916 RepID=UPI003CCE1D8E